jgi:hypothetical protein
VRVAPAASVVDGKLGWLGEFGKCWVSKVYPAPCRYALPLMPVSVPFRKLPL